MFANFMKNEYNVHYSRHEYREEYLKTDEWRAKSSGIGIGFYPIINTVIGVWGFESLPLCHLNLSAKFVG
jgi:hypothetical protein